MPDQSDEKALAIIRHLARAHQLLQLQRPAKAEAEFRAALQLAPDNAPALTGLATCNRFLDDLPGALNFIQQALRQAPANTDIHYEAGVIYSLMNQHKAAIQHFEQSLEQEPENTDYLFGLAMACHRSGGLRDIMKAEKLIREVLVLNPQHAQALQYKAAMAQQGLHFSKAEKYLRQLGKTEPENLYLQSMLAEQSRRKGDIEMALEHHLAALRKQPGDVVELYNYYETYAYENRLWRTFRKWDGGLLNNPLGQFIVSAIIFVLLLLLLTKAPNSIPKAGRQGVAWLIYLPISFFWTVRLWPKWVGPRHRWHFPFTSKAAEFLFLDLSGAVGAFAFGIYLVTENFLGVTTAMFLMIYGAIAAHTIFMPDKYFARPMRIILIFIYICGAINLSMSLLDHQPFQLTDIIAGGGWILIILCSGLLRELKNRGWWRER